MFSTSVIIFIKCQNRYDTKNDIRYKSNINKSTSYANSTKLPAMVLCLGEPPGGFCDVGCCCCFSSLEAFTIPGYFSLPLALHPGFSGPWRPPPALSSTLATFSCFTFCQAFSVRVLPRALRFSVDIFYPQAFLSLHFFSDIFGTACDSDAGRSTLSSILICACPHRVVASGWRMDLSYSYCSYKTIDLSIAPVSHKE